MSKEWNLEKSLILQECILVIGLLGQGQGQIHFIIVLDHSGSHLELKEAVLGEMDQS